MFRALKTACAKSLFKLGLNRHTHSHSKSFSGCVNSYGTCKCSEKLNQIHEDLCWSTFVIITLVSSGIIFQGIYNNNTDVRTIEKN
jgi:hypothetical protein